MMTSWATIHSWRRAGNSGDPSVEAPPLNRKAFVAFNAVL